MSRHVSGSETELMGVFDLFGQTFLLFVIINSVLCL